MADYLTLDQLERLVVLISLEMRAIREILYDAGIATPETVDQRVQAIVDKEQIHINSKPIAS